jgi:hypothetical protein
MNYELAKQLKDAGFPFNLCTPEDNAGKAFVDNGYFYKWPTLSELIAACGKDFHELHHCQYGFADSKNWRWTAYPHTHDQHTFNAMQFKGQTPEEAVADLWLALNEKQ